MAREAEAPTGKETPRLREGTRHGWHGGANEGWEASWNHDGYLAGTIIQKRASAFGENFQARRRVLRAGPGANEEQKQNPRCNDSYNSHEHPL
jgi:hypothetical protein